MYPNPFRPNFGIFVHRRVRAVAELHPTRVVVPVQWCYPNENHSRRLPSRHNLDGLEIGYHPYFRIPRIAQSLYGPFLFRSLKPPLDTLRRDFPFALIDVHWIYPECYTAVRYARARGLKVVATVRGNEAVSFYGSRARRRLALDALRGAHHVIAVSADLRDKLLDALGLPPARVTVIGNGVDPDRFHPMDRRRVLSELGLPDTATRRVLAVARLSPEKGLDTLIRAASALPADVECLIVGDGPSRSRLTRLARQTGVLARVRFVGERDSSEIANWLNAADLLCCPSRREGCPNVVLEAMACGLPVVASRVGGIPDLVRHDALGVLVPPHDAGALAEALREALRRPWDRQAIARHGRARTWDDVAREVDGVFRRVQESKVEGRKSNVEQVLE